VAVAAFLAGQINFTDIAALIEQTLQQVVITNDVSSLERILEADAMARTITNQCILAMH
jgi:1-deoxy-D-xylulose 5-phosphate reductoisomerase